MCFSMIKKRDARTNLASVVNEGKLDFVVGSFNNICDLGRYPSLFLICEPDPGSLAVNVLCHGPGGCRDVVRRSLLVLG